MVQLSDTKRRQQRADDIGQMIANLAETNDRLLETLELRSKAREADWGPEDDVAFEKGLKQVEANRQQIRELQSQLDAGNAPRNEGPKPMVYIHNHDQHKQQPRSDTFRLGDGSKIRALSNTEKIVQKDPGFSVGNYLCGLLTNDYSRFPVPDSVRNAQSAGSDTAGGYLVPAGISEMVLDLARANSIVLRAGGQTLPMTQNELSIVRVTSDPTVTWRSEGVTVPASEAAFDRIILRPRVCATVVPLSIELIEDSPNAPMVVEQAIQGALGAELDRVALEGSGSASQPLGLRNVSGVNTIASVGTPSTYSQISLAIGDLRAQNWNGELEDLAWIMSPRTADTYDGLVTGISSDNTPLLPTPRVSRLQRFETTSISNDEGAGSDESWMAVGDFSNILIGMRTQITLRISFDGVVSESGTDVSLTSTLQRAVVAYMRIDIACLRPSHFTILTGVHD